MGASKENQLTTGVRPTPKEQQQEAKPSQEKAESGKPSSQSGKLLAILALIVAVTGIAGSYILWRKLINERYELTSSEEVTRSTFNTIQPEIATLQTKLDALETQLNTQLDPELKEVAGKQQLLQESLQSLQTELGKAQTDGWVLAEAEYLLRIANVRLQLERDISTTIAALSIADTRLRDTGNPALIDVRRQLSDEITALEAIKEPDITGIGLSLHSLEERIALLPVKGESIAELQNAANSGNSQLTPESGETRTWKKVLNQIWAALKSLVTIRRINEDDVALMPPEQRDFLKQNLRLQLETARLALFRRDDLNYHSSLGTANECLTRYFNTGAGSVASMLDTLEQFNAVKLDPVLPDISGSLNSLHQLLAQNSTHITKQQGPAKQKSSAPAPKTEIEGHAKPAETRPDSTQSSDKNVDTAPLENGNSTP